MSSFTNISSQDADYFTEAKNIFGMLDGGQHIYLSTIFSLRNIDDGTGGVEVNINIHYFGDIKPTKEHIITLLEKSYVQFKTDNKVKFKSIPECEFGDWSWHWTGDSEVFLTCRES